MKTESFKYKLNNTTNRGNKTNKEEKNMGKINLEIPDDLHDKLRIMKVNTKKEIRELIIDIIREGLKSESKQPKPKEDYSGYFSGLSYSDDGDAKENKGVADYWIVKITSSGELNWQRSYGGSGYDVACSVQETIEGGYIIAGISKSNDHDVTANHGEEDAWIIKLTSSGELEWEKSLGGSLNDGAKSFPPKNRVHMVLFANLLEF